MQRDSRRRLPLYVHRKRARGHTYYYFDTGARSKKNTPILKRLPDLTAPDFGAAWSAAYAVRQRRASSALPPLTLNEMADRYEKSPEFRKLADSTQRTYLFYLKTIRANLGMAPASEVTRPDVLRLLDTMQGRPGAANMVLSVTTALYSWGRRRGLVTIAPAADIESHESTDYPPWPEELLEEALASDDVLVRREVALLYFTAQRISDVCRMRWSDIRDGVLHVTQQKTGKDLEIPLHTRLVTLLGPPQGITILTNRLGRPRSAAAVRNHLQQWATERGFRIVPHGLRKNAVNALLEAGCSIGETSAISGQSLQIVEHYAKLRNRKKLASAAILKWENKR